MKKKSNKFNFKLNYNNDDFEELKLQKEILEVFQNYSLFIGNKGHTSIDISKIINILLTTALNILEFTIEGKLIRKSIANEMVNDFIDKINIGLIDYKNKINNKFDDEAYIDKLIKKSIKKVEMEEEISFSDTIPPHVYDEIKRFFLS